MTRRIFHGRLPIVLQVSRVEKRDAAGSGLPGFAQGGVQRLSEKAPPRAGLFRFDIGLFVNRTCFVTGSVAVGCAGPDLSIGRGHLGNEAAEWLVGLLGEIAVQRADLL
jgi:hypothetical protein